MGSEAADEFFGVLADVCAEALETLERIGVELTEGRSEGVPTSPSARAFAVLDVAISAVDKVHGYLKREQRTEADFAVGVLAAVALVLRRMEEPMNAPLFEREAAFALAFDHLLGLVATGIARPQPVSGRARGRPVGTGLERQDEKTVYRWLKLVTAEGLLKSDAWDRVLQEIPNSTQNTRGRMQVRAKSLLGDGAPSSDQRRPVRKARAKALRYARLAIAEAQLRRAGYELPPSPPQAR